VPAQENYIDMEWSGLITLWVAYNNHLSGIIENIPEEAESAQCNIGKDEPVTLKFVIEDYIHHLQHHLEDILTS
jgi:hypothetical protein